MDELIKKNNEGELTVSSLTVANEFGRNHRDVLRSIRKLIDNQVLNQRDFAQITFLDKRGREQPAFSLTERKKVIKKEKRLFKELFPELPFF